MRALVIGSEGNIGSPLVDHLRAKGHDVLESDIRPAWRPNYLMADINHPVDLLPAFDWRPDVVFLLSAMVSRATCERAASLAIATNLAGINNVLQLCRRVDAMTAFFSTSEVYGPECDAMDEAVSNPRPNNRYGLSKLIPWVAMTSASSSVRPVISSKTSIAPCGTPYHRLVRFRRSSPSAATSCPSITSATEASEVVQLFTPRRAGRVRRRSGQVGGPFALWEDRPVLFNSRADFFDAIHAREAALAAVFGHCRRR